MKAGKLRWQDVVLGREKPSPTAFALLVDGKPRRLVVGWEDGRLELLSTAASGEWEDGDTCWNGYQPRQQSSRRRERQRNSGWRIAGQMFCPAFKRYNS